MQLGIIGLGRMGGNMRDRLRNAGHEVFGFDRNPDISDVPSLAELTGKLSSPRVVWVMVPAQVTEETIDELAKTMGEGDLIIDGGNSRFSDDGPRAERLAKLGIGYVDCGVSGGIWARAWTPWPSCPHSACAGLARRMPMRSTMTGHLGMPL